MVKTSTSAVLVTSDIEACSGNVLDTHSLKQPVRIEPRVVLAKFLCSGTNNDGK